MADLTEILRRAEMQQINLQTEVQFQQNLAFFKTARPDLYNQFAKYTPETLRLLYTNDGYLNLVNYKHNNIPVYRENPVSHMHKTLERYLQKPTDFKCNAASSAGILTEKSVHLTAANSTADLLGTLPLEATRKLPASVNFMVMVGIGLGYQLQGLLEATQIRHMCIIEPQADIFYASAHAIDWQPIFQHFSQEGHTLELIIGKDHNTYIQQFNLYISRIGAFNAVNPFIFHHLTSNALQKSVHDFFARIMQHQMNALGYFDDEQVGLAHTIKNTLKHTPILHRHAVLSKKYLNKPAFIVANGPSLDMAVEFLQKNQGKAIIFSCGTALGSLKKIGIKPDFHIEMERTKPVIEWITSSTDEKDRKDVILLALNTVHPQVFELFEKKGLAMKANDVGTHYLTQYIKQDKQMINFSNCNPTVGNCALAYVNALGFKDVYLFGLDFGFSAGEQHHSKFSKHYEVKKSEEHTLHLYKPDKEGNPTVPGNFGGEIIATPVYKRAILIAEDVLKSNKAMHCYNTSRGALIRGAEPLPIDEIALKTKPFNKKQYATKLFSSHFSRHILRDFTTQEVEKVFHFAIEALTTIETLAQTPVGSYQQGMDVLGQIHTYITSLTQDKIKQYTASLLKGSLAVFAIFLAQALCKTNDEAKNVALYNQCLTHFITFLNKAKVVVQSDLLAEDERTRNLQKKLEKTAHA
jgi:hypothetical protein